VDTPDSPSVILVGTSEHVRPDDGATEDEIDTVPANPLTAVIVIVDEPTTPAFTGPESGLALRVKSWTVYVAVTECDNEPLPPATVILYKPTDPPQDNVEVPWVPSAIVPILRLQLSPVEGETEVVSATAPAKPSRLVTVIVAVPA